MQKEEMEIETQRFNLRKAMAQADYSKSDAEKREAEIQILKEETGMLDNQLTLLKERRAQLTDPASRKAYDNAIEATEKRRNSTATQGFMLNMQADPNSLKQQMAKVTGEMKTQFGTLAQNIANGFKNVVGTAINSISDAITGLILRTKSWSQALSEVGTAILGAVVKAIVQAFVTWIVQMLLIKALSKVFATDTSKQATEAAANWAPAAIAASIATEGEAAAVGGGAAVAAIVIGSGIVAGMAGGSGGGFASGGYTGDGSISAPAGIVHRREFVINAPATAMYRPILEKMNRGDLAPRAASAAVGGRNRAAGGGHVHVSIINDRQDMREFQAREGAKVTADFLRKRGLRTV